MTIVTVCKCKKTNLKTQLLVNFKSKTKKTSYLGNIEFSYDPHVACVRSV